MRPPNSRKPCWLTTFASTRVQKNKTRVPRSSRKEPGRSSAQSTATVDLSPLFVQLNQRQIGRTGRMFLVRDDGTVIEAPGITPAMNIKSEEYAAVRDALGSLRGRQTGYLFATLSNGQSYLIGFADAGLKEAYPTLPWTVLASQEAAEVTGPIRNIIVFAVLLMILAFLMLSLLAAYVVLHTKQRLEDIETPLEEEKEHAVLA